MTFTPSYKPRSTSVQTRGGIGLRITGAKNAKGKVTQFRLTTLEKIVAVLEEQGPIAVEGMQAAADAHFSSGEGIGRVSSSLVGEIAVTGKRIGYRIKVRDYRETKYLTTLVSNSNFEQGRYPIWASPKKTLHFFWKREGRETFPPAVMHPGFGIDILREAGIQALDRLGTAVEMEVRTAVATVFSGDEIID